MLPCTSGGCARTASRSNGRGRTSAGAFERGSDRTPGRACGRADGAAAPELYGGRVRLLGVVDRESVTAEERPVDDTVFTWPHLLVRHVVVALGIAAVVLGLGVAFSAPLRGLANPNLTPEPAKAPWYFAGLQELLSRFDPLVAGILVPAGAVLVARAAAVHRPQPGDTRRSHRKVAIVLFSRAARDRGRCSPSSERSSAAPAGSSSRRGPTRTSSSRRSRWTTRADATSSAVDGSSAARCLFGAAAYTGYEALRPLATGAGGAKITVGTDLELRRRTRAPTCPPGGCTSSTPNDYLFALSQKCPHLGCHVPFCESSGRFECPCHGSVFDLARRVHRRARRRAAWTGTS